MFITNFKILGAEVPEKPLTQILPTHYIRVRDEKRGKIKKKAK